MNETLQRAADINRKCICQTLDKTKLEKELSKNLGDDLFLEKHSNIFSQTVVYISSFTLKEIEDLILKIEAAIQTKSYQDEVLRDVPDVALKDFGTKGVFMGYDFHLTDAGPMLIEINTNAGGGLLNYYLAQSQKACCDGVELPFNLDSLEEEYFNMFLNEWKLQKGDTKLHTIVILDVAPKDQYLYPEFKLFSSLFKKHGLECFILAPEDLEMKDDEIWYGTIKIDFIYNRLTDFYFEDKANHFIKDAYLKEKVVISPNPHHHALYANKHNLEWLCKIPELSSGIPLTEKINFKNQELLWKDRREYFFKPASGYGGKAAYRGDKMTTKVWGEIKELDFVAQKIVKPGERIIKSNDGQNFLKLDVRAYVYNGKVKLLASRLYSGQTTNFRTDGGGFAPVFLI
jgi:hypothetical protein